MEQRYQVARVSRAPAMIYNEILEKTGASSATIIPRQPQPAVRQRTVMRVAFERLKELAEQASAGAAGRRMSAYGALAAVVRRADARRAIMPRLRTSTSSCFQQATAARSKLLLDLCCGTGTLTLLMAARGYEMIADRRLARRCSCRRRRTMRSCRRTPSRRCFMCQEASRARPLRHGRRGLLLARRHRLPAAGGAAGGAARGCTCSCARADC